MKRLSTTLFAAAIACASFGQAALTARETLLNHAWILSGYGPNGELVDQTQQSNDLLPFDSVGFDIFRSLTSGYLDTTWTDTVDLHLAQQYRLVGSTSNFSDLILSQQNNVSTTNTISGYSQGSSRTNKLTLEFDLAADTLYELTGAVTSAYSTDYTRNEIELIYFDGSNHPLFDSWELGCFGSFNRAGILRAGHYIVMADLYTDTFSGANLASADLRGNALRLSLHKSLPSLIHHR